MENFRSEIAIAYDVFMHQWLPARADPKVSADIAQALAHMYPLLPTETIIEQACPVVLALLRLYRRSIDRNAITQLLASVVKTSIDTEPTSLDTLADTLIGHLFDLVCVNPDYEKPQTVKGHYEALRCFDLLLGIYSTKIFDMLLVQLRNNNERERVKSLLVLIHLTNKYDSVIRPRSTDFTELLRQMLVTERSCKMKMILLKTIVAFAQKGLVTAPEFIRFILRHCCALARPTQDMAGGTIEEQSDLIEACQNSMYILATTVTTMDELLLQELLNAYLQLDHTSVTTTIAKCLSKLYARRRSGGDETESGTSTPSPPPPPIGDQQQQQQPNSETIFVRSLILMGNPNELKRTETILQFLKHFCPALNKHLRQLWLERIPEMAAALPSATEFADKLYAFLMATIKDVDDFKFAESLTAKLANQLSLYPQLPLVHQSPPCDWVIPNQQHERGTLLKLLGICVAYVSDQPTVTAMIDLITSTARAERLDKHDESSRLSDACRALGHVSRTHLDVVLQKLNQLVADEGTRKSTGNFFSGLTFLKDSGKEADMYKINLLAIEAYQHIVQMAPPADALRDIDTRMVEYLCGQFADGKDVTIRRMSLQTLEIIVREIERHRNDIEDCTLTSGSHLLSLLFKCDTSVQNLPLLPQCLRVARVLIQIDGGGGGGGGDPIDPADQYYNEVHGFFEESARKFFTIAQQLRTKFDTVEEDERNSFLARHLNLSLPELNGLVTALFEKVPSPATLDDVHGVLEVWMRNRNSEVRICAGHVMNHALAMYLRTVRIGGEAPAKFNQAGSMLAGVVPRCIDSNATVRQTSVEILQRILEVACIYETLTIADPTADWMRDLAQIQDDVITDDSKEIYRMTGELARVIALRLSSFQYLQFW